MANTIIEIVLEIFFWPLARWKLTLQIESLDKKLIL